MYNKLNIHDRYKKIQKSYEENQITFQEYSLEIMQWNKDFNDIIKSQVKYGNDLSHGGKLHKKEIIDKQGRKITKWVRDNSSDNSDNKNNKEEENNHKTNKELEIPIEKWEQQSKNASEKSLENASKFASSSEIRRIANNELLKRRLKINTFIDMSIMPSFMLDTFIDKYKDINKKVSKNENKSIAEYRDNDYYLINKKLRNNDRLDQKEKTQIKNIDNAISKSELTNDIVLYRGLSGKDNLLFINYLNSLKPGDVYEEKSFSSTSLLEGQAHKFKDLYSTENNLTLKIYASKGQNALSMQNLGGEDEKIMYKDEYEFLLPRNSKMQIIENKDGNISLKLL